MLRVTWQPNGRTATQPPNAGYLDGCSLDCTDASKPIQRACSTTVPYPADGCGVFAIDCDKCDLRLSVTAAGRRDDPRVVTVPCGGVISAVRKTAWVGG